MPCNYLSSPSLFHPPPSPLSPLPFLAEIIMHDGVTAVYRSNVDLFFYVLGAQGENEVKF